MLTLLPQFWSKQSWRRLETAALEEEEERGVARGGASWEGSNQAFLLIQQISANIVSYCRVAMTMGGESVYHYVVCAIQSPHGFRI